MCRAREEFAMEVEVIDLGVQIGLVEIAGAWYSYKTDRIGQGKKNASEFLAENTEIAQEIETAIRAKLLGADDATTDEEEQDVNHTPVSNL